MITDFLDSLRVDYARDVYENGLEVIIPYNQPFKMIIIRDKLLIVTDYISRLVDISSLEYDRKAREIRVGNTVTMRFSEEELWMR